MGWKSSRPHESDDKRVGPQHVDIYHTDDRGKRDQPHKDDFKISHNPNAPEVRDIKPPSK